MTRRTIKNERGELCLTLTLLYLRWNVPGDFLENASGDADRPETVAYTTTIIISVCRSLGWTRNTPLLRHLQHTTYCYHRHHLTMATSALPRRIVKVRRSRKQQQWQLFSEDMQQAFRVTRSFCSPTSVVVGPRCCRLTHYSVAFISSITLYLF